MDGYVLSAEEQAKVIRRSYNRTRAYVQSEIEKILHHVGDVDSPAYEYRMKRLASLLQNTEKRIKELYGITLEDTTSFLKSIIPEAYYHTIFDIAQGTGIEPSFAAVNEKLINAIVKEPWSGKNYSKRIWANTDKLSNELREVLTTAAISGESISKTLRKVADSFNTSSYNAERLIRTETTYACNQAEIASYNELDIDRYKYVATLDTRTSPICQKLDGKIFETAKARAGLNLPAMHPNCRSTTIPYFEDFEPTERAARDADGKPIRVPADMTYPEWYDKYVKPKEEQNTPKTPQKPTKGKDTNPKPEATKTPQKPPEKPPAEIDIPAPKQGEPEFVDTPIPKRPTEVPRPEPKAVENNDKKPVNRGKVIDKSDKNDIIDSKKISVIDTVGRIFRKLSLDEFKDMKGKISKEQRKILYGHDFRTAYINSSHAKYINADLREGKELTGKYKLIADTLSEVIGNNVIQEDIEVVRYVGTDAFEAITGVKFPVASMKDDDEVFWTALQELEGKVAPGIVYTEKGFTSTSAVEDKNVFTYRNVLMRINVPEGTNGYITTNKKESEVIFNRGTKIRVDRCEVQGNRTSDWKAVLYCTLVG